MLDTAARRALAPMLNSTATRLSAGGISALSLTVVGWLFGIGACVAAASGWWVLALILWLANRLMDGLDGPVARQKGATELGGFLDIVADFSIYAGFIVGVAIAVPQARLACVVLLTTYYLSGAAFLALSSLLERRHQQGDGRSLQFVGGVAEGTETVIVYALICLLPTQAESIVWIFALAVAVTAIQRVVFAVRILKIPQFHHLPYPANKECL